MKTTLFCALQGALGAVAYESLAHFTYDGERGDCRTLDGCGKAGKGNWVPDPSTIVFPHDGYHHGRCWDFCEGSARCKPKDALGKVCFDFKDDGLVFDFHPIHRYKYEDVNVYIQRDKPPTDHSPVYNIQGGHCIPKKDCKEVKCHAPYFSLTDGGSFKEMCPIDDKGSWVFYIQIKATIAHGHKKYELYSRGVKPDVCWFSLSYCCTECPDCKVDCKKPCEKPCHKELEYKPCHGKDCHHHPHDHHGHGHYGHHSKRLAIEARDPAAIEVRDPYSYEKHEHEHKPCHKDCHYKHEHEHKPCHKDCHYKHEHEHKPCHKDSHHGHHHYDHHSHHRKRDPAKAIEVRDPAALQALKARNPYSYHKHHDYHEHLYGHEIHYGIPHHDCHHCADDACRVKCEYEHGKYPHCCHYHHKPYEGTYSEEKKGSHVEGGERKETHSKEGESKTHAEGSKGHTEEKAKGHSEEKTHAEGSKGHTEEKTHAEGSKGHTEEKTHAEGSKGGKEETHAEGSKGHTEGSHVEQKEGKKETQDKTHVEAGKEHTEGSHVEQKEGKKETQDKTHVEAGHTEGSHVEQKEGKTVTTAEGEKKASQKDETTTAGKKTDEHTTAGKDDHATAGKDTKAAGDSKDTKAAGKDDHTTAGKDTKAAGDSKKTEDTTGKKTG